MEKIKFEGAIRYVLRYAIEHSGKASYNPCMYHLGYADNVHPSEEFNDELRKYGCLEYGGYMNDFDYYRDDSWSCFRIDERGRNYMKELEPKGLSRAIRFVFSAILSIIQILFVIEGWISYFLNSFLKFLSSFIFLIAFISFVWWPLDMLCGFGWMGCDWLKYKLWNRIFTWEASSRRWTGHFPEL